MTGSSPAEVTGGAAEVAYPPEPWHLGGDFLVGVFLVPVGSLPDEVWNQFPRGARPLQIAGRVIVGVAAVRYGPGGVLAYDELLVAIPVIARRRVSVTIPQIWVTSPASRAGGRALWGIPKELMSARRESAGRSMRALYRREDRAVLAEATGRAGCVLPGTWSLPLPTLQRGGRAAIRSSNSVRARIHLARTRWAFGSSLSWLQGRRPALSVALTRAKVVFGARVDR